MMPDVTHVLDGWTFGALSEETRSAQDVELRGLGLEDTFQFECTRCGNCCVERHKLHSTGLTVWELYRIAEARRLHDLGRVFHARLTTSAQWLTLHVRQPGNRCAFQDGGLCRVHQVKPAVCRLAPLGTAIDLKRRTIGLALPVKRPEWCPGMGRGRVWTVREWLDQNDARLALAHTVAELEFFDRVARCCKPLAGPTDDSVPAYIPGEMFEWVEGILWHPDRVWQEMAAKQGRQAPGLPDVDTRWGFVMYLWLHLVHDLEEAFAQGPGVDAEYAWERLGFRRRGEVVTLGAAPEPVAFSKTLK